MAIRTDIGALLLGTTLACAGMRAGTIPLPAWVPEAGAQTAPSGGSSVLVDAFGAVGDGVTDSTAPIQKAINAASAAGGGVVRFSPGTYRTGALFLKSHVHMVVDAGVTLKAVTIDQAYPKIPTRVAGIEMDWPAALLNVNDAEDVEISGAGIVDGQGQYWWKKYWDLRKVYQPKGLRWAADYDCERVRLLVIWKSKNVTISGLNLHRAGFWTVQVAYSKQVSIDHVTIADNFAVDGVKGPSTDGIDIDSSDHVLVEGCDIDNNDDDICLKAGRDADGLRVNRPTEYVVIRDNICRRGGGVVSFGSETSGGIRHIVAYRDKGVGTSEGLRFKSTRTRGGSIEDVLIEDITLTDVPRPFTFTLDWNPAYSSVVLPPGVAEVPAYWRALAQPVSPPERGYTTMSGITIASVTVTGADTILTAAGFGAKRLGAVHWKDVHAEGAHAGSVRFASEWTMKDVAFETADGEDVAASDCTAVQLPAVSKLSPGALLPKPEKSS